MTHNILPSDIVFALKLIEAKLTDGEIVSQLVQRNVEPDKAARLVADLRRGKEVFPEMSFEYSPPGKGARGRLEPALQRVSRILRLTPSDADDRPAALRTLLAIGLLAGLGLGVWGAAAYRYHTFTDSMLDDLEKTTRDIERLLTTDPSKVPSSSFTLLAGDAVQTESEKRAACRSLLDDLANRTLVARQQRRLQELTAKIQGFSLQNVPATNFSFPDRRPLLEVGDDGLRVSKTSLTRTNALDTLSTLLGSPTRTNHVVPGDRLVYIFDRFGLLVYSQNGIDANSIVLDFEALGGTNGATSPFSGALRVDGQEIGAETPSDKLAVIKQLALSSPGAATGIFAGRCHHLGFCFAYFKLSQRLSLIEIDLD